MPELKRPDGATIHWDDRGRGQLVVFALQFFGLPGVLDRLIEDLAVDHRVVTYDIRGAGASSRRGPYDLETDSEDLEALVEEVGPPALVIAIGDGTNRAVRVAARRPELVNAVLAPGGNPVGRIASQDTEGLAGSASVIEAMVGMMETDYRGALRSILSSANPQYDDRHLRDRVQATATYCPQEAAAPRMAQWVEDDVTEAALEIGGRLWMLEAGGNPWFPIEVIERTRELLPEAQIESVEDGPVSRPDITAGYVRKILETSGRRCLS